MFTGLIHNNLMIVMNSLFAMPMSSDTLYAGKILTSFNFHMQTSWCEKFAKYQIDQFVQESKKGLKGVKEKLCFL